MTNLSITRPLLSINDIEWMDEQDKNKAIEFLKTLKEKINLAPTVEKIAFYRLLEDRIRYGEIDFDVNGKGRFLLSIFGSSPTKDSEDKNWLIGHRKANVELIQIFMLFVPEFFQTINESFKFGTDLAIPEQQYIPESKNKTENSDLIKKFWSKFDPIFENEMKKGESCDDTAFYLVVMKCLKACGENLPLTEEAPERFYVDFRQIQVIEENLASHSVNIANANFKISGCYDMIVYYLFCFAFKDHALSKKENELFSQMYDFIYNQKI